MWTALAWLAVAACAGRGAGQAGRRAVLLSDLPSELGPGACEVVLTPAELPRVDSIVDSVLLTREIARVWAEQRFTPGHVLVTLAYDELGRKRRLAVVENSVAHAAADSGRRLVDQARRSLEREPDAAADASVPPPAGWGVRLRIDVTARGVEARVGRQEYCPPRSRDPELEDALFQVHGEGLRYREGRLERTILVKLWIHPAGYVTRASISRGVPLTTRMQEQLVDFVRQFSFFPGLLDGEPVEGWLEIPIRVRG